MEHKSSFNKRLRIKLIARAVMNKTIKMLEVDLENIDENNI